MPWLNTALALTLADALYSEGKIYRRLTARALMRACQRSVFISQRDRTGHYLIDQATFKMWLLNSPKHRQGRNNIINECEIYRDGRGCIIKHNSTGLAVKSDSYPYYYSNYLAAKKMLEKMVKDAQKNLPVVPNRTDSG